MQQHADLTGMTLEELDREATWLAGHLAAAEARLVAIVGELDRRGDWLGDGVASPAHWLSWRTGLSPGAARERVRVARALNDLPVLAAAFADGTISYSKVRAATRVATPATDEVWTDFSRSAPAVQIERLAREQARQDSLTPEGAADLHAHRRLTWRWDDDGSWVFSARLPPLAAAVVLQALHAALDDALDAHTDRDDTATGVPAGTPTVHPDTTATHRDDATTGVPAGTPTVHPDTPSAHHDQDPPPTAPTGGPASPQGIAATADRALNLQPLTHPDQIVTPNGDPDEKVAAARADALVAICDAALAGSRIGRTGADRYRVIIHTYVGADGTPARPPHLDHGPPIAETLLDQIRCDSTRHTATHDATTGELLDLGRTTRDPSPAQRRALTIRDRHCQGPACDRTRHLDGHHLRWWSDDGPTDLANLLLLCGSTTTSSTSTTGPSTATSPAGLSPGPAPTAPPTTRPSPSPAVTSTPSPCTTRPRPPHRRPDHRDLLGRPAPHTRPRQQLPLRPRADRVARLNPCVRLPHTVLEALPLREHARRRLFPGRGPNAGDASRGTMRG